MRWYIHGNLTPAVAAAIQRHEHTVQTVLESESPQTPEELFKLLQTRQWDLITNDKDLIDARLAERVKYDRAIVYLSLKGEDVEQDDAVDRLFARYKSPKPGQLYTVTETRVKVRQLK